MKRFLILMLALALCLAFIACEEENVPSESNKPSYSVGLRYELKDDDTYKVVGIGDCTDKNVIIPNEHDGKPVTSIGDFAFSNRVTFTSVTIPDSVTSIGESAFWGCTSLTSVTIPDSVTSIGNGAFWGCTSLTSVTIPDSVTSIGNGAIAGCSSLTSIVVDENNTAYKSVDGNLYTRDGKTLVQYAIGKTATSFEIPNGVETIGYSAFSGCKSLSSVTIGNGVTWIGSYAFEGCTALASVTIPNSVASIGNDAFSGCKSLTSVEIPTSVTSIGSYAFYRTALTSVVIPDSVTFIGNDAFSSCTSLTSILVDENNTAFKSIDGNLYSKDGKTFIQYAVGKTATSFEIPSGVTSIAWGAFRGCTALASVTIPNSVKTIGDYAFAWCTALTIYCEAESKPSGWSSNWNPSDRPVVWGHK